MDCETADMMEDPYPEDVFRALALGLLASPNVKTENLKEGG